MKFYFSESRLDINMQKLTKIRWFLTQVKISLQTSKDFLMLEWSKTLRTRALHTARAIAPSLFKPEKGKMIVFYSKGFCLIGRKML